MFSPGFIQIQTLFGLLVKTNVSEVMAERQIKDKNLVKKVCLQKTATAGGVNGADMNTGMLWQKKKGAKCPAGPA